MEEITGRRVDRSKEGRRDEEAEGRTEGRGSEGGRGSSSTIYLNGWPSQMGLTGLMELDKGATGARQVCRAEGRREGGFCNI